MRGSEVQLAVDTLGWGEAAKQEAHSLVQEKDLEVVILWTPAQPLGMRLNYKQCQQ